MIMTHEREFLKAQKCFEGLVATVQRAFEDGRRIDELEGSVFQELLQLGLTLVATFIAKHGDGNVGSTTTDKDANTCKRLAEKHARPYKSIFGELTIERLRVWQPRRPENRRGAVGSAAGFAGQ